MEQEYNMFINRCVRAASNKIFAHTWLVHYSRSGQAYYTQGVVTSLFGSLLAGQGCCVILLGHHC